MSRNATLVMDANYRRTYTHDFLVITDDVDDLQGNILEDSLSATPDPIPSMWSNYNVWKPGTTPFDADVYLQSKRIQRLSNDEDNRHHWIVTCTWSPPAPGTSGDNPPTEDPLTRPIKYRLDWASYTKMIGQDIFGNPITNSAGDLFNPGPEIDDARPVLVATKNIADLSTIISLSLDYTNAINTDTFYGAPAYHAKVQSILSGDIMEENGVKFYSVTFRVEFNYDSWLLSLIDKGTHVLEQAQNGTNMVKVPPRVLEDTDSAIAGDLLDFVFLNPDGTMREPGLPGLAIDPPFHVYPQMAFSGLGI